MIMITSAPLSPVAAVARQMCEQHNRTVHVFEDEDQLAEMLSRWPELQENAVALFTVPEVPARHYACGRERLKALGREGVIPAWTERFARSVAVLDLDPEEVNARAPNLAHALTQKLGLPVIKKRRKRRPGRKPRTRGSGHFACA